MKILLFFEEPNRQQKVDWTKIFKNKEIFHTNIKVLSSFTFSFTCMTYFLQQNTKVYRLKNSANQIVLVTDFEK